MPDSMHRDAHDSIFAQAAGYLRGQRGMAEAAEAKVKKFLAAIGYAQTEPDHCATPAELRNRAALLGAAAEFGLFRLRSRSAPGLTFFGGTASPRTADDPAAPSMKASITGAGVTLRDALQSCIGEGIEYISQFRDTADRLRRGSFAEIAPWNDPSLLEPLLELTGGAAGDAVDWIAARRLPDGEAGWLPAGIVVRDRLEPGDAPPRFPLSSGCAAGPDRTAATASALFELLERDAVAMWWKGGAPAAPIALEVLDGLGASKFLADVRQDAGERVTSLLDISGSLGVPCVAALSFDRSGRRFAGGYACHPDAGRACRAAIVEMCQMELGLDLVLAKRARMDLAGMSAADLAIARRGDAVAAATRGRLGGLIGGMGWQARPSLTPEAALADVLDRLAGHGYQAFVADLTRPAFDVAVARVMVPGLQPYPARYVGRRLAAVAAESLQNALPADSIELL